jgi:hypothetical protein
MDRERGVARVGVERVSPQLILPILLIAGFSKQELEVPGMTLWVSSGDLDGDTFTDLIVSYKRGSGPASEKFLAIFFRGKDGYSPRPDLAFAPLRHAAMFDIGDSNSDGADEILYLTSGGVYSQTFSNRKPQAPTKLINASTLAGTPEEEDFPAWDFLRDVKGLGKLIVLPSRTRINLFTPDPTNAWKKWCSVEIDHYSFYDTETATFRRSAQGGSTGRPYSIRVTTVVPNLDFLEQTGDGKIDLVTNYDDRVSIHPQLDDGTISAKPSHVQWMKALTSEELENRDTFVSSHVQDIDGDGIADLSITKIGGGITTLASEVRIYRGRKGGGFETKPAQNFRDEGFGALSRFVDVDGDGRVDMVHPHAEVSIVTLSSAMLSSSLSLDVRIRRPSKGPDFFDLKPVQTLDTSFGLDLSVGASLRGSAPIFGHDFDGDGVRDALLSDGGDKMALHRGKKGGGDLFDDDGPITLSAEGSNTTEVLNPSTKSDAKPDVLVYYVARKGKSGKLLVFRNTF